MSSQPSTTVPTEHEVSKAVEGVDGQPLSSTQKMAVKFLLSNVSAGVIIGRGGSNITELQQHSSARIQLSRNSEFYPGTNERVMLISGTVKSVLTALYLILTKLSASRKSDDQSERRSASTVNKNLASQLKIVMPSIVCGAIIGKGGDTIRSFAEDSGATISVSPQDHTSQKAYNRIVSISGSLEKMLRAVALVVSKVAGDPKYINNICLSVNYSKTMATQGFHGFMPPAPHPPLYGHGGIPGGPMFPPMSGIMPGQSHRTEITMAVPDEKIGSIIGKGGEVISQLQFLIGVKIVISGRNDFEPGTRNRRVTIMGPVEAVYIAQMIVAMKALREPVDSVVFMERKYKERAMFVAPGMYRPPYTWHRNMDYANPWSRHLAERPYQFPTSSEAP